MSVSSWGENRPLVRFEAIGVGWRFFKARRGTWILAGLLVVIANGMVHQAVTSVFGKPFPGGVGFRAEVPPAATLIDAVLAAVVNGFFLGGMFRMACRQVRGERMRLSDLWSITDVIGEFALGSAIFGGACCLLAPFGLIPAFILAGVWMFTIPLIVDARLPALDAIGQSWRVLKGEWFRATLFHGVVYVIAGLGLCCLCLGLMFTLPMYCLPIAVLYRIAFGAKLESRAFRPTGYDPDF